MLENKPAELTNTQTRILAVIPNGQENALPTSFLVEKAALDKKKKRDVQVCVSDLIFDHGFPIGSSSDKATRGIFMIENEDDLKLACHTLNSRINQIVKRKEKIIENYYKQNQIQLDLDKEK